MTGTRTLTKPRRNPTCCPAGSPNLLVNGSQGIAVGMATNIPPHNLREVVSGMIALIDDPEIDLAGLMEHIKGPDFPTGGVIMGRSGIRAAYAHGRRKHPGRAPGKRKKRERREYDVVIPDPPMISTSPCLLEPSATWSKISALRGISDLNDLSSSRTGMKILVEIRSDANPRRQC